MKMGHDSFGGHMSVKRTKARISFTFYWPSLNEDCRQYIQSCRTCQLKARVTYRDRVPITPILRATGLLTAQAHFSAVKVRRSNIITCLLQSIVSVDFQFVLR